MCRQFQQQQRQGHNKQSQPHAIILCLTVKSLEHLTLHTLSLFALLRVAERKHAWTFLGRAMTGVGYLPII